MDAQEAQKVQKIVIKIQKDLDHLNKMLQEVQKPSFSDVPGVEGTFDGIYMVSESGEKFEVPANYAAKSRLLYGDDLKMVESDGKTLFKQVSKRPRKKIEGVLSKKEGEWYFLADSGSYKISNVAAEFNKAEVNDKAVALVPEDDPKAPFAALDRILKDEVTESVKTVMTEEKPVEEKKIAVEKKKPIKKTTSAPKKPSKPKTAAPKKSTKSENTAEPEYKGTDKQEVSTLRELEEEDLR